jgi:carbon storage regulator CsrA
MLIISRKKDQKIVVADEIEITILEVGRNRVRFGIKAPKHIPIQTRLKTDDPVDIAVAPVPAETEDEVAAVSAFMRRR